MNEAISKKSVKWLTLTAVFMALNVVLSSFSVPVPGGHLYLNDIVICTAALLFDPVAAFLAGGVGAFLGDLFFYPTPMFVTLVVRGLQALAIALCARKLLRNKGRAGAYIGLIIGAVIMVVGYSLGRAFIYSTPAYAWAKLPFQIGMAALGVIVAPILCYGCGLEKQYKKMFSGKKKSNTSKTEEN